MQDDSTPVSASKQAQLLEQIAEGREAEQIKNNPVYAQAKRAAQSRIIAQWINTELTQTQEREMLWHDYRAVSREQLALEQIIQQGSLATIKLQQLQQSS